MKKCRAKKADDKEKSIAIVNFAAHDIVHSGPYRKMIGRMIEILKEKNINVSPLQSIPNAEGIFTGYIIATPFPLANNMLEKLNNLRARTEDNSIVVFTGTTLKVVDDAGFPQILDSMSGAEERAVEFVLR